MDGFNLFKFLEQYDSVEYPAPKSMKELPELAEACKKYGFNNAAEYIIEWLDTMNKHKEEEWLIGVGHDNSTED